MALATPDWRLCRTVIFSHVEGESTVFIEFMLAQIDNILDELLNQMTNSATDDAILDANGANHDVDNMECILRSSAVAILF